MRKRSQGNEFLQYLQGNLDGLNLSVDQMTREHLADPGQAQHPGRHPSDEAQAPDFSPSYALRRTRRPCLDAARISLAKPGKTREPSAP
jgi:hypothetical protein